MLRAGERIHEVPISLPSPLARGREEAHRLRRPPRPAHPHSLPADLTKRLTVAAYVILGSILAWSRLAGLRTGYCCDEIRTVTEYVREGPTDHPERALHPEQPRALQPARLGHELRSRRVRDRASALVGDPVPHRRRRRHGVAARADGRALRPSVPLPRHGVAASARHLSHGARLRPRVLAMSVMIVAALELDRSGRRLALVAFVAAGLVGSFTLPALRDRVRRDGPSPFSLERTSACPVAIGTGLVDGRDRSRGTRRTSTTSPTSTLAEYGLQIHDGLARHRADRPDARAGRDAARRRIRAPIVRLARLDDRVRCR